MHRTVHAFGTGRMHHILVQLDSDGLLGRPKAQLACLGLLLSPRRLRPSKSSGVPKMSAAGETLSISLVSMEVPSQVPASPRQARHLRVPEHATKCWMIPFSKSHCGLKHVDGQRKWVALSGTIMFTSRRSNARVFLLLYKLVFGRAHLFLGEESRKARHRAVLPSCRSENQLELRRHVSVPMKTKHARNKTRTKMMPNDVFRCVQCSGINCMWIKGLMARFVYVVFLHTSHNSIHSWLDALQLLYFSFVPFLHQNLYSSKTSVYSGSKQKKQQRGRKRDMFHPTGHGKGKWGLEIHCCGWTWIAPWWTGGYHSSRVCS